MYEITILVTPNLLPIPENLISSILERNYSLFLWDGNIKDEPIIGDKTKIKFSNHDEVVKWLSGKTIWVYIGRDMWEKREVKSYEVVNND